MEVIRFKNKNYPKFQAEGNAAKFCLPFAKEVCKGNGLDIGCCKLEWSLPNSIPVDPQINEFEAMKLPEGTFDYIFSSHCLEHVENYVSALEYWKTKIVKGGTLFLYLPDYSQEYWRPWNNRKHIHCFTQHLIGDCLESLGYKNIYIGGVDLNNSFIVIAEV